MVRAFVLGVAKTAHLNNKVLPSAVVTLDCMVCPVVFERGTTSAGERIPMQLRDFFFPLVRVCLIITVVEWLAIVRNLCFHQAAQ